MELKKIILIVIIIILIYVLYKWWQSSQSITNNGYEGFDASFQQNRDLLRNNMNYRMNLEGSTVVPDQLTSCVADLQNYKALFTSMNIEKQTAINEAVAYRKTIEDQNSVIGQMQEAINKCQSNVETAERISDETNEKYKTCAGKLDDMNSQLNDTVGKYNQLISNYSASTTSNVELQNRLDRLLEEYTKCNNATMNASAVENQSTLTQNNYAYPSNNSNVNNMTNIEYNGLMTRLKQLENEVTPTVPPFDIKEESVYVSDPNIIEVDRATYGQNCNYYDAMGSNVTDTIINLCEGKRTCKIPVSNDLLGDPAQGCTKELQINWRCNGNRLVHKALEGEMINLIC